MIGSFRSNCDPPSSNGTPTVSLDNQNRLDFNTGGLFVPERASKSKPIGIWKGEGVLTHEFIPMKNVVRQRGINFGEFTSSRIPLSTSRSPPSPPLIVLQLDTTGHASRLSSSRPTRRRRINTLANKSQRKREGGGIGFAPGK